MNNMTRDEAYTNALVSFDGDELASGVLLNKYAISKDGNFIESTYEDISSRLSTIIGEIANDKEFEKNVYKNMVERKLMPAGRVIYALGNVYDSNSTLSNCYVLPSPEDSIEGIFKTATDLATIFAKGGGCGVDISTLRPLSGKVSGSAKETTGSVSFMDLFSTVTGTIGQHGRRGALLLSMSCSHPDLLEFIKVKGGDDKSKVENANISIRITDEFMKAIENDKDWEMKFYIPSQDQTIIKIEPAKKIWDLIIKSNWNGGEPGMLFWDTVLSDDPSCEIPTLKPVSTNPCLTGDTIVAVADGRNGVTIKELSETGEKFNVYSARRKKTNGHKSSDNWKVEIKGATAFRTGEKELITIYLSDGSNFSCTKDHKLALESGDYIEAQYSTGKYIGKFFSYSDKNTRKNYRHINSKTSGKNKQYRMIYEYNKNITYDGKLYNIDHKDGDASNDDMSNLELITIEEHKLRTKRHGLENPIHRSDKQRHKIMNGRKNRLSSAKRCNWSNERLNEELRIYDQLHPMSDKIDKNVVMNERIFVERVESMGEYETVYDLTVDDNHNFYIITKFDDRDYLNSSGVLVHNCGR